MHRLSLFVLALLVAASAQAQTAIDVISQGMPLLERGFSASDARLLRQARATFDRATADRTHGYLAHYYAALADARLANVDGDRALDYVEDGIEHLERVVELRPTWAEGHALLASLYGRKAGLRPIAGMILGPKTSAALERAKELAPDNPRVVYLEASSQYFRPRMWGGDKEEGARGFRRAIALFDRAPAPSGVEPSWGHEEALTWLGIALAREDELAEARQMFTRALRVNPDYRWVRDQLLPQLETRISSN